MKKKKVKLHPLSKGGPKKKKTRLTPDRRTNKYTK